jgi:hypothetical protein
VKSILFIYLLSVLSGVVATICFIDAAYQPFDLFFRRLENRQTRRTQFCESLFISVFLSLCGVIHRHLTHKVHVFEVMFTIESAILDAIGN